MKPVLINELLCRHFANEISRGLRMVTEEKSELSILSHVYVRVTNFGINGKLLRSATLRFSRPNTLKSLSIQASLISFPILTVQLTCHELRAVDLI